MLLYLNMAKPDIESYGKPINPFEAINFLIPLGFKSQKNVPNEE